MKEPVEIANTLQPGNHRHAANWRRHLPILILASTLGLGLCGCVSLQPCAVGKKSGRHEQSWSYRESVRFDSMHDPWAIQLSDGRRFQMGLPEPRRPEFSRWKPFDLVALTEDWRRGRPCSICFETSEGPTLEDSITGIRIPIVSGFTDDHPLDRLDRLQEEDEAMSTPEIEGAITESRMRWEAEANRMIVSLSHLSQADQQQEATFQELRAARIASMRSISQAALTALGNASGTKWNYKLAALERLHARNYVVVLLPEIMEWAIAGYMARVVDPPTNATGGR